MWKLIYTLKSNLSWPSFGRIKMMGVSVGSRTLEKIFSSWLFFWPVWKNEKQCGCNSSLFYLFIKPKYSTCIKYLQNDNSSCVFCSIAQYLKSDLMHQFDCQVNDFVDSLIEESAVLEPAPVPDVFSPPLTEKERSKLGCCPATPTCL